MFKLIVLLFAVVNGQVASEPITTLKNNTLFGTEELCQHWFDTPRGELEKQALEAMVAKQEQAYQIEYKCEQVQDNTI